jgi:aspartyl-tRNA(Asn)/glutamyl-tRNA(Gln) amidotransferase subunit C
MAWVSDRGPAEGARNAVIRAGIGVNRMTRMTAITRADVEHLAKLARLELTEDELDHYAGQLDVILQSVARVSEVAADDIPPTSHPIPMENVFREDVALPGLDRDTVAASAPAWEDDRFRVPRILDEE